MAKKDELLTNFRRAKSSHERWLSYAEAIYNGVGVSEKHTPLSHTDCEFGKWMLETGQVLYHLKSSANLAEDHKQLHLIYMDVYKLMHVDIKGNIFIKGKLVKEKNEKLEKDMVALRAVSQNVIQTIDNLIDEIQIMSDSKADSLFQ